MRLYDIRSVRRFDAFCLVGIFIREASSRIYSSYVFAIAQLIGEMPYSVLCAVVFWCLMVWPMGFGQGTAGKAGNAFQLLMILFMELFGSMYLLFLTSGSR